MDDGHIIVDSIVPIRRKDITYELARESGFTSIKDLLETASDGRGDNIYLIRFHYLPAGAWDVPRTASEDGDAERTSELLRRIRSSTPPAVRKKSRGNPTKRSRTGK